MNTEVMFSSKTDAWATPADFYQKLNSEFHFDLDPCADEYNHKCDLYFDKNTNGLLQSWGGGITFLQIRLTAAKLETGLKKLSEQTKNTEILW